MNHSDTMKLALEALEWNMGYLPSYGDGTRMAINAITALREALAEQSAQQEPDWKDQYEKQKRRAEMWIAKYEADIGPLEKAGPVTAQQPVVQCTESDSWNCKYCRKTESCKALQDPRNFAGLPAQQQQEPYGWHTEDHLTDRSATTYSKDVADRWKSKGWPVTPLYTSPQEQPSKPRVRLTPEQRATIAEANNMLVDDDLFDAIEAKLREKNT